MKEYKPEDILIAREERVEFQQGLTEKYKKPIVVVRVNYPGLNKNNKLSEDIINIIKDEMLDRFKGKIVYKDLNKTAEGPTFTVVIEEDTLTLKKGTIAIEEKHTLGRCVDIDVYDAEGAGVSRTVLNIPPRKCYLCGDMAQNCVRARRHSVEDIIKFMQCKYDEYMKLSSI